jgi:hypothetical protein
MLLVEFSPNLTSEFNILKYREINDDKWYYLHIDIETLNLLINNLGIISTYKNPTQYTCCDNITTSTEITVKYCGAPIKMYCQNKSYFYLPYIEQNW